MKSYEDTIVTFTESISWGGAVENETLADVLANMAKKVPSLKMRCVNAKPGHTGNWPQFEMSFDISDIKKMAKLFDCSEDEFRESYLGA